MHNDDISQVLILNKKSISNYETQLFQQELEKFRPHQNRLLQANQKQSALMKELTGAFNSLLQDKRVRSEQSKYEAIQRQRSSALNRYKKAYQEFLDLYAGLQGAKNWYSEMRDTVGSLEKNVETYVNNRRSEGAQLLDQIEREKSSGRSAQAALEQERMRGLMERMSMEGTTSPAQKASRPTPAPLFQSGQAPRYPQTNFQGQYQTPTSPPAHQQTYGGYTSPPPPASTFSQPTYNPSQYGPTPGPTSPPPNQTSFGMNAMRGPQSPPATQTSFGQPQQGYHQSYMNYGQPQHQQQQQQQAPQQMQHQHGQHGQQGYMPQGFVPPPPPPGPPPLGPQQTMHYGQGYDSMGGHAQSGQQRPGQGQAQQPNDPWAGLSDWK